jgi:hypothetical protein
MTVSISQPATVSTLLRELGMSHVSVEKSRVVLGTWLTSHEPQLPLRLSLRENGFGPLLHDTGEKRERPRITA